MTDDVTFSVSAQFDTMIITTFEQPLHGLQDATVALHHRSGCVLGFRKTRLDVLRAPHVGRVVVPFLAPTI